MASSSFNWKGITDNGDGTYTADTKTEKKRLLKVFHQQGYSVRSSKQADGSWLVTPMGQLHRPSRSRTRSATGRRRRSSDFLELYGGPSQMPYRPRRAREFRYGRMSPYGRMPAMPRGPAARGPVPSNAPMAGGSLFPHRRSSAPPPGFLKRRSQEIREQQQSPYNVSPEGKTTLKPGYIEYQEHGMTKTVREQPRGFIEKHFPSQERQHALQTARVQRSQREERGMEQRSTGPSTRVQGEELLARTPKPRPAYREEIRPAARQGITQSPHTGTTQIAEPSRVRKTSPLPQEDLTALRSNAISREE